jgi:hypothetical protein
MKNLKYAVTAALLGTALATPAQAAPKMIKALGPNAQVFEFYVLDAVKLSKIGLSTAQELVKLQGQLAPFGLKPCQIDTDINGTGVICGDAQNGLMEFGTNEFFTYNFGGALPGSPIPNKTLDAGVNKRYGSDVLTPTLVGQVATAGRPVQIHFSQRVAQFGMLFAEGTTAVSGVQFIVNRQALPVTSLDPAIPTFVGVEDPHGFTDVTIVPSGGQSQAYVVDHFSFLPLTQF